MQADQVTTHRVGGISAVLQQIIPCLVDMPARIVTERNQQIGCCFKRHMCLQQRLAQRGRTLGIGPVDRFALAQQNLFHCIQACNLVIGGKRFAVCNVINNTRVIIIGMHVRAQPFAD